MPLIALLVGIIKHDCTHSQAQSHAQQTCNYLYSSNYCRFMLALQRFLLFWKLCPHISTSLNRTVREGIKPRVESNWCTVQMWTPDMMVNVWGSWSAGCLFHGDGTSTQQTEYRAHVAHLRTEGDWFAFCTGCKYKTSTSRGCPLTHQHLPS